MTREELKQRLYEDSQAPLSQDLIRPETYCDASFLEREIREVLMYYPVPFFGTGTLKKAGDVQTQSHFGSSFFGMRGERQTRIFINACKHRGHPLVSSDVSNVGKHLRCGYHSWTYDLKGSLERFPGKKDFPNVSNCRLDEVNTSTAFGLVWGTVLGGRVAVEPDWFAKLEPEFEVLYFEQTCAANWKLLVEANLEVYHVQSIHRRTLAPTSSGNLMVYDEFGRDSRMIIPMNTFWSAENEDRAAFSEFEKHLSIQHFIFPATLYLNVSGKYALVVNFEPLSVNQTSMRAWVTVPKIPRGNRQFAFWMNQAEFIRTFLREDIGAAERVQSALCSRIPRDFNLGHPDRSILAFHNNLHSLLEPK